MGFWFEDIIGQKAPIVDVKKRILVTLMHVPGLSFNQLWGKQGRSNSFAYHLKTLEEQSLIKKKDENYVLTALGKRKVAYLNAKNGEMWSGPIVAVITVVTDGKKYLLFERNKEPFRGYWGIHGGKLHSSLYILEQAVASIKEETGLECFVQLKGLFSSKTFEQEELAYNHQLFIVKATDPKGTLLKKSTKGTNAWKTKEELHKLKTLPNIPDLLKIVESKRFRWIEADRFIEDGEFKGMNIIKDLEL